MTAIDLHNINYIARHLGCPAINEAGLYLYKKIEDEVKEGEVLYTIYANDPAKLESGKEQVATQPAYTIE